METSSPPAANSAEEVDAMAQEPTQAVSAVDVEAVTPEAEVEDDDSVVPQKRQLQTTSEQADDIDARAAAAEGDVSNASSSSPPAKKQKKKSRDDSDEDDDRDQDEREETPMTEQQRRRLELSQRIDAAVKGPKRRPKKKADETDLDQAADDEVIRMHEMMVAAAMEDQEAKKNGQPATSKLRMLKEAVETLQKTNYQQAILDNNLLEAVRMWLEPLEADGSLPSLNIQRALFPLLENMYIDTTSLKMSKLGGLMLFYTKKKGVDKSIQRTADRLIETWSRPILKRSSSYRDRLQASREFDAERARRAGQQRAAQIQKVATASQTTQRARIPESVTGNAFRYAPSSQVADPLDDSQMNKLAERQRINKFKRSMMAAKR